MAPYIAKHPQGVLLRLKVVPGASRDRVIGPLGDTLKVAVSAPAASGKANEAVIELIAETLGVSKKAIAIVKGHTQPRKQVAVIGVTMQEVEGEVTRASRP